MVGKLYLNGEENYNDFGGNFSIIVMCLIGEMSYYQMIHEPNSLEFWKRCLYYKWRRVSISVSYFNRSVFKLNV